VVSNRRGHGSKCRSARGCGSHIWAVGDRTDYHDLISLLWASLLRSWNEVSVRLIDIPPPVIVGELSGRYVLFEKQPGASYISLENPNYELLERLLLAVRWPPESSHCYIKHLVVIQIKRNVTTESSGRRRLRNILSGLGHRDELRNERVKPNWLFYRRNDWRVTAFRFQCGVLAMLAPERTALDETVLDAEGCYLVKTGALKNTIDKQALSKLFKLLRAYGVSFSGPLKALLHNKSALFLPTESHLICITDQGLLAIESEGGLRAFQDAELILRQRQQNEARVLHSSTRFQWCARIDDERFEELILDLLNREPGVRWVRRVGTSRASDSERDLIAEWLLRPAPWESATRGPSALLPSRCCSMQSLQRFGQ